MMQRTTQPEESALHDEVDSPALFTCGAACGKYRVIRLLARGGMSEVYEAVHSELQKHVALKVLSPVLRTDREAHMRFAAEAINAACLVHTHILDVIDCGVVDGLPYLVMNLLVGCDLATHFARRGKLPPSEIVDILLPVAKAVAFGHRRGIMHRDLKPENIFLHKEGSRSVPKVLDFGVSRMLGVPRITTNIRVVGTPHYMAPEQARAEKSVGPAADQYSLGVILYEGLTGQLPRQHMKPEALLYSVAYGSFPPPSKHVQIPVGLERVVLKMMATEPGDRFGSMNELSSALLPYASAATRASRATTRRVSRRLRYESVASDVPFGNVLPSSTVRSIQVLNVTMLLALVGKRTRLVTALVAAALMLGAVGMWLLGPGSPKPPPLAVQMD